MWTPCPLVSDCHRLHVVWREGEKPGSIRPILWFFSWPKKWNEWEGKGALQEGREVRHLFRISVALIFCCIIPGQKEGLTNEKITASEWMRIGSPLNSALKRERGRTGSGAGRGGQWGVILWNGAFVRGLVKHLVSFFCSGESCFVSLAYKRHEEPQRE